MNPEKSLWGNLPLDDMIRTPVIILREQATILTKLTNGLLEGVVTVRTASEQLFGSKPLKEFSGTLGIVAAALDGYMLLVLKVEYDLAIYPVTTIDLLGGGAWEQKICHNEEELMTALGEILSSERVSKSISLLLAQSRSTAPTISNLTVSAA